MEIFVANEQDIEVDERRLSALAAHVLGAEGVEEGAELSVLLVTSDHMQRLNARFAGNDYATDVLSFPLMEGEEDEDEGPLVLGDVVICPPVAAANAAKLDHGLEQEIAVLLVHGTLHLLGYDHQGDEDKAKMDARLQEILSSFTPATA